MNTRARDSVTAHRGFLLDTSVISALAPGRESQLPTEFGDWLHQNTTRLYVPCIAVAELAQGICKLHRSGGVERAGRLAQWLDQLIAVYGERILALTLHPPGWPASYPTRPWRKANILALPMWP